MSPVHTLSLKGVYEMAGAFSFFTGDIKESEVHEAQPFKSFFPGRLARARALSLVAKSQALASLSLPQDVLGLTSRSVTVPSHQSGVTAAARTVSPLRQPPRSLWTLSISRAAGKVFREILQALAA